MRNLIAVPVIIMAVILQSSVVSRLTLLSGFGDLPLVMLAPRPIQLVVHAVGVAVFAGRQILGERLGVLFRPGAMNTGIEFLDHVGMGEFLVG